MRRAAVCLLLSLLMVVADFMLSNSTFPIFDETAWLQKLSFIQSIEDRNSGVEIFDDVMAINMAFEKSVAPVWNEDSDFVGYESVTDRAELLRVLDIVGSAEAKFIFMDVEFKATDTSPADSALFAKIASMPNILVPSHIHNVGLPSVLGPKGARADFKGFAGDGFARYEFLQHGLPSVAERMYEELNGGRIEKHSFFYTDRGRLCYNCCFLRFPRLLAVNNEGGGLDCYPVWRSDWQKYFPEPDSLRSFAKDKVVIIGDFNNDVHTTYAGSIPGPMLNYCGYLALAEGEHIFLWFPAFLLWLVYAVILYYAMWPSRGNTRSAAEFLVAGLRPALSFCGARQPTSKEEKSLQIGLYIFLTVINITTIGLLLGLIKVVYFMVWNISPLVIVPVFVLVVIAFVRRSIREWKNFSEMVTETNAHGATQVSLSSNSSDNNQ